MVARNGFEFKSVPHSYVKDDVGQKCYSALLAAYEELPNEIEDLCLKLIGLREDGIEQPPPPVVPSKTKAPPPITTISMMRRRIEKKVLPGGPSFEKDREFQHVCLGNQNFICLVRSNPALASQILLAAIIQEPEEWEDIHDDGWRSDERLGTAFTQQFYPPCIQVAHFLIFRTAPRKR